MENKKVYNINAMRPVLLAAHEQGNRRMIDKKFCAEHGVSEGYFKVYKKNMETLFEAVSAYARAKNSPKAKPSEVLGSARGHLPPLEGNALLRGAHCPEQGTPCPGV